MKLASIEQIVSVENHSNADLLDIVGVLGFKCITKRDQYKVGDIIVFIQPDTVLPDKPWAAFYKAKSSRVKSIRLRGQWSEGVVESLTNLGLENIYDIGTEVSDILGITKYDPPLPQDLSASGVYGNGIPRTDEERVENLEIVPWNEVCDVTLKIDGQSATFFFIAADGVREESEGVGGRSFVYKIDCDNNYTKNAKRYDTQKKLREFCTANKVNLCIRGEQYGAGIQKGSHNPHSKVPLDLALFSTYLIDELKYARKGHPHYIFDLAPKLGLPTVPIIEKDVLITPELIKKYSEDLTEVNGQPFEGVVINWSDGSFKVINKSYDSKK